MIKRIKRRGINPELKKRAKHSFAVLQREQENKEFERSKYKVDKFGIIIKEVNEED